MLRLTPPERTPETLRAIAGSGSSGLARKAQAELRAKVLQSLSVSVRQAGEGGR